MLVEERWALLSFRNLEGYLGNYQVFSLGLPFVPQRWLSQIKNATGAALKITTHGLMASVFSLPKEQRNKQKYTSSSLLVQMRILIIPLSLHSQHSLVLLD